MTMLFSMLHTDYKNDLSLSASTDIEREGSLNKFKWVSLCNKMPLKNQENILVRNKYELGLPFQCFKMVC